MEADDGTTGGQEPPENPVPRELLEMVEQTPFHRLTSVLDAMADVADVRKSSKSVSTHWLLDILAIGEPRSLVLTATLYFEHLAKRHRHHVGGPRKPKPLALGIGRLLSEGYIDRPLHGDMRAVIAIRNEFAHNLYYDLSDWDPLTAPFLAKRPPRMPIPRHLRRTKNIVLLKILSWSILYRLHDAFPWLTFENAPRTHRRRSNQSLQPTPRSARSG